MAYLNESRYGICHAGIPKVKNTKMQPHFNGPRGIDPSQYHQCPVINVRVLDFDRYLGAWMCVFVTISMIDAMMVFCSPPNQLAFP